MMDCKKLSGSKEPGSFFTPDKRKAFNSSLEKFGKCRIIKASKSEAEKGT